MKAPLSLSVLMLSLLMASHTTSAAQRGPSAVTVVTEQVDTHEINQSLSLIGKLKAAESVVVASEVAGKVEQIAVKANQNVEQGQLLIKLNDDKARAALVEAQAYLRKLLELPPRLGGLGLSNPQNTAQLEFENSLKLTGHSHTNETYY